MADAALGGDTNDPVIFPRVTTLKCDLPQRWLVGRTFKCQGFSSKGVRLDSYTITEASHDQIGEFQFRRLRQPK